MISKTNLKNKLVFTEPQLMVVALIHAIGLSIIFLLPLVLGVNRFGGSTFGLFVTLSTWVFVCGVFIIMVGPDWVFGCFFPLGKSHIRQLTKLAASDSDVAHYLARVYACRETLFGIDLSRCEAAIERKAALNARASVT